MSRLGSFGRQRRHYLRKLASLPLVGGGAALILTGTVAAAADKGGATAAAASRLVLVLGDSLSAEYGLKRGTGWVAMLGERLAKAKPPWLTFNASISGETTSGGLTRLPALLQQHKPRIVVIELGGNDALRGLDLGATQANLDAMVVAAQATGAKVLILGMRMPPNYGRAYSERFERLYREVASGRKAALVPFFLEGVGEKIELFQPDRIHPTEQAQPLLLANAWPALQKLL